MNKQKNGIPVQRILLNNKQELAADTCNNVDEPQIIMLSERRQTQRLHIVWLQLYEISRKGKTMEIENQCVPEAERERGLTAKGHNDILEDDESSKTEL